jgi:O-antigen ligase
LNNTIELTEVSKFNQFRDWMLFLTRCSIVLLLYGVAASMALASLGTVLTLVFWVLTFDWGRPWRRLTQLPVFWPLLAIPLLVLFSTVYSIAPLDYAFRYYSVYSRFFVILIIIAVIDTSIWQKRCWIGFFAGAAVTLSSTYLGIWFVLPWSQSQTTGLGVNHSVFYDYIAQGVMTSFIAVIALSNLLTQKKNRIKILWTLILLLSIFSITHLLTGRTGQVVCLLALLGVIFIALPTRQALMIAALLLIIGTGLVISSNSLLNKFTLMVSEVQAYQQGQEMTSIGARLAMWNASWGFYWDQPIWGHGTGSYRWLAERVFTDSTMCKISCVHPHNQFLFFGVEHGIFGVVAYILLFVAAVKVAWVVERRYRLIIVGLMLIILVDSFINSPFWISSERNFYMAIFGLVMTSFYLNNIKIEKHKEPY